MTNPSFFDPTQKADVEAWRKTERERLLSARAAMEVSFRHDASVLIAQHLDRLLAQRLATAEGLILSVWWPIKAELNLRNWFTGLQARGVKIALPVVLAPGMPLVFRLWRQDCRMVKGVWKIPVPADGPEVTPDITLAPLVGWDPAGYRLGYGGGYFDRTLAAIHPMPLAIGVGLQSARLATIFPQPHDIPLQTIVTETGVQVGG